MFLMFECCECGLEWFEVVGECLVFVEVFLGVGELFGF